MSDTNGWCGILVRVRSVGSLEQGHALVGRSQTATEAVAAAGSASEREADRLKGWISGLTEQGTDMAAPVHQHVHRAHSEHIQSTARARFSCELNSSAHKALCT